MSRRYYVDNNVSSLINKFEVRNYPKNSRMAAPEPDEELYVRRRIPSAANGRERHVYLNDSAVFYDSVESVPPNVRFRTRYGYNDSLSSLNESDYGGGAYDSTVEEYQDEPLPISKEQVASSLSRFGAILQMLSKIPFPRMSVTGMGLCSLVAIFICPRTLGSNILFPGFRLLFGTLYPAYASYKAVRTKNVKEYVKWMMYWIVFAFFTCIETFTDILLSWFPFYYEIKVIIVLWLLSPATRGSSTLYRKFVHPMLTRREQEIDDYINQAKEKGYTAVLQLGSKGVNYATNVIMQTAIKGGGGLVQTLRKSYSLSDLSEPDTHRTQEEIDELTRPQRVLRSKSARSSSGGRHVEMYFPEVEIAGTPHHNPPPPYNYIRSSDDISSGYSSAEPGLSRTASMSNSVRPRVKSKTREDDDVVFYDGRDTDRFYGNSSQFVSPSATLFEIPPSPLPAITQASYFPESHSHVIYTAPSSPNIIPPEVDQNYELFLKWMESQKQIHSTENISTPPEDRRHEQTATSTEQTMTDDKQLPSEISTAETLSVDNESTNELDDPSAENSMLASVPEVDQSEKSFSEDLFRDTVSISSEDEFLEIETDAGSEIQLSADIPLVIDEPVITNNLACTDSEEVNSDIVDTIPTVIESVQSGVLLDNSNESVDLPTENHTSSEILSDTDEHLQCLGQPSSDKISNEQFTTSELKPISTENLQSTAEPSNQLSISISDLTSSTSSLALSDGSSQMDDLTPRKPLSHGKRKAPPVPTAIKPVKITPILETTSTIPKLPERIGKPSLGPVPPPEPKHTSAPTTIPDKDKDKKHKSKKLMSSLTGMFKHDGPSSSGTSSANTTQAQTKDSLLPRKLKFDFYPQTDPP
nr:serine-rich adhesin for platelets-like isoform X1 [Aedes albopictus]